jgi:AcrR family transcriptional regulator
MGGVSAVAEIARPGSARPGSYTREEPREPVRLELASSVERERIGDIQRARILAAMTQVACERGAAGATVANVVTRAGVSRRTFYEEFSDSEDCFLAALEQTLQYAVARVLPAYEAQGRWRERIRAGLAELLRLFDERPPLARMLVVESLSAGPRALERRAEALVALTAAVDAGREQGSASGATLLTAEGVVGAVLSVIHTRLCAGAKSATRRAAQSIDGDDRAALPRRRPGPPRTGPLGA